MRTIFFKGFSLTAFAYLAVMSAGAQSSLDAPSAARTSAPIPMDQLGAVAGKQYQGDGLSVIATPDGARLRCAFQRLEGEVTRDGLWLRSTAENFSGERFRVMAVVVGRSADFGVRRQSAAATPLFAGDWLQVEAEDSESGVVLRFPPQSKTLPVKGSVLVNGQTVQFLLPGLTEEYSVSVDGVRQDFIVEKRPAGDGELRVELAVTGAKAEPLVNGARLVLDGSGRKLAYNRLRVMDERGQELIARLEVTDAARLAVVVDDASAVYPIRIDPTFSDADWISLGGIPGANNTVNAALVDGSGNLYIGGDFTVVGEAIANRIAKWDGSTWSALGSGLSLTVRALAVEGTNLYAGGDFSLAGGTAASRIAKWDGVSWSALGSGMNDIVYTLAVLGNDLYAGGRFSTAGGTAANYVAKWDGSAWLALGPGMNNWVKALTVSGTNLFAGGLFTAAGVNAVNYIAQWDGALWTALGAGMNFGVYALAVEGTNVYAGGDFTTAGGANARGVAKWNGSGWLPLGSGLGTVYALGVSGTNLYAGGQFLVPLQSSQNVARWNGSAWVGLGSGVYNGVSYNSVFALAVSGTNVYVGGDFATASGSSAKNVAKWNGSDWSTLSSGLNSIVYSVAVEGSNLYAGGAFTKAGDNTVKGVAKWSGGEWTALGSGINGLVYAMAIVGTNLYVGGSFNTAGGITTSCIARWNGTTWSALGSGIGGVINAQVRALGVAGTDLFAAGNFTTAGGTSANYIARWNGSTWSALGSGMNSLVNALMPSGPDLFAGGQFTNAGGTAVSYIAKWNGIAWLALGSGMNSNVNALAVSGVELYAGGEFTTADGIGASRIAKWDGNAWSALGLGMNSSVNALAVSGSDVYAGGVFTQVTNTGGVSLNLGRIAKWDGSEWSALGSGMNNVVNGLLVSGTNLYATGNFTTAGSKVSAYIAKANIGAARGRFSNLVYSPATGFSCTFSDGTVGQPYRIQSSPSLVAGPWTELTNFTYAGPIVITDASAAATTNTLYRAVTP